MKWNVGVVDRVLRIAVGLALLAFALQIGFPATEWNWLGWIGVIPLITGLVGTCPVYSLLGVSTCAMRATE